MIHQEYFNAPSAAVWSDENYIALVFDNYSSEYEVRLISTTTFVTERSFGVKEDFFHYDRGLLFVAKRRGDKIRSVPINCRKKMFYLKVLPFTESWKRNQGSGSETFIYNPAYTSIVFGLRPTCQ